MGNQPSASLAPNASDTSVKSFANAGGPPSPTWSSKSSMCGSTGTGITSRHSQSSCRLSGYSDHVSHIANTIGQASLTAVARASTSAAGTPAQISETMSYDAFNDGMNPNNYPLSNMEMEVPSATATSEEVLLQTAPAMDVTGQALRRPVFMTPMQMQMHQQLKAKHAELFKKIIEQQEELRKVSEQLLMTQYGLVPVSMAPMSTLQNNDSQLSGGQSQINSSFSANVTEMNWQNNLQSQQQNVLPTSDDPLPTPSGHALAGMQVNQLHANISMQQRNFTQPQQMQQPPQQR